MCSYENACATSLPGVSGCERANRTKAPPVTLPSMSFRTDGLVSSSSRRARINRSWDSVSRSCSRKIAASRSSPAISGALRICARACTSIECMSVR